MLARCLLVLAVCGLALPTCPADDAAAKAVKELEGEWRLVEAELGGKKMPEDEAKDLRMVIKGEAISIRHSDNDERKREKTFKLDPTKSPKQIDITSLDGQEKDQTAACIYSLEKGRLKLCIPYFTKDPSQRPTEFKTKDGDGVMLMVLERVKAK